jgi:hypothetical protein
LPLPKTEFRFLCHSFHSLVTIQTELNQQTWWLCRLQTALPLFEYRLYY